MTDLPGHPATRGAPPPDAGRRLSSRALGTPEPLVRLFTRRVQQEGALDLTQGDHSWDLLQTMVDAEDASRLLIARELRPAWSALRELGEAELTIRGIEQMLELERLRGGRGA